jgi:hypothetical protein
MALETGNAVLRGQVGRAVDGRDVFEDRSLDLRWRDR